MLHMNDEMVERHVTPADALAVMRDAYLSFGQGHAAMQERIRTESGGVKLSTLGAVLPDQQVAGAKVYTTIQGRFSFVILIFSTVDGRPLASFDAGAITRLRTAACSTLAAQHLARSDARVLALYGAGTQGSAHARQFAEHFALQHILLCDPYAPDDAAERLSRSCGVPVSLAAPEEAVAQADLVITASRSPEPLFSGQRLRPGAFVAAIGSSLPHTRELDDSALERCAALVVEWRTQSMREAGDIVMAAPGILPDRKIVELAQVVTGEAQPRRNNNDILIYKSVGVGLEDVALAGFAYSRIMDGKHA
ncbi:ornithine cyclodeaminase family protein [Variovorax terrae]|uniref:Ornithine cyclodeaminase family protein n=1 Tax=Variovorax terrae TaxID=2923278 RepID=A0A9X1VW26_9BURK|nr:ornithine cyclodeaminase family protein [Variovorax terrae]MCJ0764442.1 ornithine cyclodeaminase family protein [Variovorax terrae]